MGDVAEHQQRPEFSHRALAVFEGGSQRSRKSSLLIVEEEEGLNPLNLFQSQRGTKSSDFEGFSIDHWLRRLCFWMSSKLAENGFS
jgi:hypothetical protein